MNVVFSQIAGVNYAVEVPSRLQPEARNLKTRLSKKLLHCSIC
jgi:hypothetical protein